MLKLIIQKKKKKIKKFDLVTLTTLSPRANRPWGLQVWIWGATSLEELSLILPSVQSSLNRLMDGGNNSTTTATISSLQQQDTLPRQASLPCSVQPCLHITVVFKKNRPAATKIYKYIDLFLKKTPRWIIFLRLWCYFSMNNSSI